MSYFYSIFLPPESANTTITTQVSLRLTAVQFVLHFIQNPLRPRIASVASKVFAIVGTDTLSTSYTTNHVDYYSALIEGTAGYDNFVPVRRQDLQESQVSSGSLAIETSTETSSVSEQTIIVSSESLPSTTSLPVSSLSSVVVSDTVTENLTTTSSVSSAFTSALASTSTSNQVLVSSSTSTPRLSDTASAQSPQNFPSSTSSVSAQTFLSPASTSPPLFLGTSTTPFILLSSSIGISTSSSFSDSALSITTQTSRPPIVITSSVIGSTSVVVTTSASPLTSEESITSPTSGGPTMDPTTIQPSPTLTSQDPDTTTTPESLSPSFSQTPVMTIFPPPSTTSINDSFSTLSTPIPSSTDDPPITPTLTPEPVFSPTESTTTSRRSVFLPSRSSRRTTITKYWTSTYSGIGTSTYSTVIETGSLSTDTPRMNGFAHDTRAIVGVAIAAATVIIGAVFLTFFACRRCKRRQSFNDSKEHILYRSPEAGWRAPIDDDYISYEPHYPGSSTEVTSPMHQLPMPGSQGHGTEEGNANNDSENGSVEWQRENSFEISSLPPVRTTALGGQSYMPGLDQTLVNTSPALNGRVPPSSFTIAGHQTNYNPLGLGSSVPSQVEACSSGNGKVITSSAGCSSSNSHGESLSSTTGLMKNGKASMYHGQNLPFSQKKATYPDMPRDPNYTDSVKIGVRGLLGRLRRASMSTIPGGKSVRPISQESVLPRVSVHPASHTPSSLLNPMPLPPAIPPAVWNPDATNSLETRYTTLPATDLPWNDITVRYPSPVPTSNSSMIEGLLHPHLGMALGPALQASSTSLRDHVDYSRPINPLIHNLLHSTTTLDIHDTSSPDTKAK